MEFVTYVQLFGKFQFVERSDNGGLTGGYRRYIKGGLCFRLALQNDFPARTPKLAL